MTSFYVNEVLYNLFNEMCVSEAHILVHVCGGHRLS